MSKIMYGCCVGSWPKFTGYVAQHLGTSQVALVGQRSISIAYNHILGIAKHDRFDAVVLQHDDLEITDPAFEDKIIEAVNLPDVAVVGVAGGGPSMSWWNVDPIGHQLTDSGLLEFGGWTPKSPVGDVHVVEGSIMVFSRWAIENLRFDSQYEFLGYDDVCLEAKLVHGKRVVVADVDTHHHSTVGYKSDAVREMWERSEKIWSKKWGHR